jgi:hypothetical protein
LAKTSLANREAAHYTYIAPNDKPRVTRGLFLQQ